MRPRAFSSPSLLTSLSLGSLGGAVVVVVAGCGLGLGGLGAPVADAGTPDVTTAGDDATSPTEAAADGERASRRARRILRRRSCSSGASAGATGLAQQTHVLYAANAQRWWLLWIDGGQPLELQAASSPDFVTWTTATPLSLPAALQDEGGDFSAAYASIAGVDVLHVTLGLHFAATDRRHFHVRATVAGGALLWGTPQQLAAVTDTSLRGSRRARPRWSRRTGTCGTRRAGRSTWGPATRSRGSRPRRTWARRGTATSGCSRTSRRPRRRSTRARSSRPDRPRRPSRSGSSRIRSPTRRTWRGASTAASRGACRRTCSPRARRRARTTGTRCR